MEVLLQQPQVFLKVLVLWDLFIKWGDSPSLKQLWAKLLAMLCLLGALWVLSAALPTFDQIEIINLEDQYKHFRSQSWAFKTTSTAMGRQFYSTRTPTSSAAQSPHSKSGNNE
jgi:hypothetical protein